MDYDKKTQAILLLTSYFSKAKKGDPKPLTPTEFARFSLWLVENKHSPIDLLEKSDSVISDWVDPKNKITTERLKYLIGRGLAMSLALEKWASAGIWIIHRKDPNYPLKLRKNLKKNSPSLLFGVGDKRLLNVSTKSLSVVGSRKITDADKTFTQKIAQKVALEGFNIVSGGARGVDEISMLSALESEGTAVGVLADSLLEASISGKWRKHIKSNNLILISTFYPEAGFNVGNAMARNKYIYCMSDAALVVHSGKTGGTYSGAIENLKKGWVNLWVKRTEGTEPGNEDIISNGGNWYDSGTNIETLFNNKDFNKNIMPTDQQNLFE